MKIIHYFLGFPPYRTGGLTRFAFDLMRTQYEQGNEIIAIWPGQMGLINQRVYFKDRGIIEGIRSIEVINPAPVPLDEGINEIGKFVKNTDKSVFIDFLKKNSPEVIHIHTLMGLHREFVEIAKELKIFTVFTTHDYFGICPKVTLFHDGNVCENDHDCIDCINCNKNALSLRKIRILQSPIYRLTKDSFFIKKLRKGHREKFFEDNCDIDEKLNYSPKDAEAYRLLRDYYISILEMIDCIHFNSSVSFSVYKRYVNLKKYVIMPITHKGVSDHRKERKWVGTGKLRIAYLAPAKPFKGFDILKSVLDKIWEKNKNFELYVFSPVHNSSPYMIIKEDGYNQSDLKNIFDNTDVLVAPSLWYETFGFTVLEAVSYGIPVILSDRVGAKDIIESPLLFNPDKIDEFENIIMKLLIEIQSGNELKLSNKVEIITWEKFVNNIVLLYKHQ